MRWATLPDRREITLLIFCLTVFVFSYNLETSLRLLGLDPVASQGAILSHLGLTTTSVIAPDGRKPDGWRDKLEDEVFGTWNWDEGHVSGDGKGGHQGKGTGGYGALWAGEAVIGALDRLMFGGESIRDAVNRWGADIPRATLVKHVPGHTIVDNAILFNGTVYLVTDEPSSFPPVDLIASWTANSEAMEQTTEWRIVSSAVGRAILGELGGNIQGVTFLSTDSKIHNSTLLTLWRTYASLDPKINYSGRTTLFPPRRLFLSHLPTFQGHERKENGLRTRSETGWHPLLAKAAFPALGIMYKEDWEDFSRMEVPFVLERTVVVDRGAAMRGPGMGSMESPSHSIPLERLEGSRHWWEPIRKTLARYFEVDEKVKTVITYLSRQNAQSGPMLREVDHKALVDALGKLGNEFEVNIVDELEQGWHTRMGAVVRSTVILGVYGSNLFDSVYMKTSPHTMVMEFFPDGIFARDVEVVANALGIQYAAWWGDQKFSDQSLPPVRLPSAPSTAEPVAERIPINAQAIIQAIREQFRR